MSPEALIDILHQFGYSAKAGEGFVQYASCYVAATNEIKVVAQSGDKGVVTARDLTLKLLAANPGCFNSRVVLNKEETIPPNIVMVSQWDPAFVVELLKDNRVKLAKGSFDKLLTEFVPKAKEQSIQKVLLYLVVHISSTQCTCVNNECLFFRCHFIRLIT